MEKFARLERHLEDRDLESVWFTRPNAFAWLTGGSNVVDRESGGVAAVGFDGSDVMILTDTIEADRIADEELPDLDPDDVTVETYPWYESSLEAAIADRVGSGGRAAADVDVPGLERVDPTPLRQPLTARDGERYRELGRETAHAVEAVCRELRPDDTELEVASALRVALSARGIETPVALVGGSERAARYRHYTPTRSELGEYALVSVTTARAGLHASCTRTVAFDPPEWLEDRHAAAARVEVTALAATQEAGTSGVGPDGPPEPSPTDGSAATDAAPDEEGTTDDGSAENAVERSRGGSTAADVFRTIQDAYEAVGFADEWRRHHQGGAAGFAGREWIATPDHDAAVVLPMAYAWNPTIQGAKSEGTVLVTQDRFEPLTTTGEWPTTTATAVGRDRSLERPAVLHLDGET